MPEIYRQSRLPPRLFPRTPLSQAMAVSRGSCRGRVLWRPHMPRPMRALPSHAISCTPIPPWSSSKCRNNPSTNQLHVFAFQVGRSVWLNKVYWLNTSSSSKILKKQSVTQCTQPAAGRYHRCSQRDPECVKLRRHPLFLCLCFCLSQHDTLVCSTTPVVAVQRKTRNKTPYRITRTCSAYLL